MLAQHLVVLAGVFLCVAADPERRRRDQEVLLDAVYPVLRHAEPLGAEDLVLTTRSRRHWGGHTHETSIHRLQFSVLGRDFDFQLAPDIETFVHNKATLEVVGANGTSTFQRIDTENYYVARSGNRRIGHFYYHAATGLVTGFFTAGEHRYGLDLAAPYLPGRTGAPLVMAYRNDALVMSITERRARRAEAGSDHAAPEPGTTGHNHDDHPSFCGAAGVGAMTPPADAPAHPAASRRARRMASASTSTCLLKLVADSGYYTAHGSDTLSVTSYLLRHMQTVDERFRASDFSSSLTGMGVAVKSIVVLTSSSGDPYVNPTDHTDLLNTFSNNAQSTSYCLAHLFTHTDFTGGVLGLAWVADPDPSRSGGMCSDVGPKWYNTGFSTSLSFGSMVPAAMHALVTTHEIGHNWGSVHDSAAACPGDDTNGHFIMYATAVDGSKPNNLQFSSCSGGLISAVLASKSTCFVATPPNICGNNIQEPGEDCDAGFSGDACCTSSCTFTPGSNCSDANNECCLNCALNVGKVCFTAFAGDSYCRQTAVCATAVVGGNTTVKCPDPAPKPTGTACGTAGRCDVTVTALESRCVPFCARYGALACSGTGDNACLLCCKHNPAATCDGTSTTNCGCPFENVTGCAPAMQHVTPASSGFTAECYADDPGNTMATTYMNNPLVDLTCVETEAKPCLRLMYMPPNTPCSGGICSRVGTCGAQFNTQGAWDALKSLSLADVKKWFEDNIVAATMLAAAIVWIPGALIICRYDRKMRRRNKNYGVRKAGSTIGTMKFATGGRQRRRHRPRVDGSGAPADNDAKRWTPSTAVAAAAVKDGHSPLAASSKPVALSAAVSTAAPGAAAASFSTAAAAAPAPARRTTASAQPVGSAVAAPPAPAVTAAAAPARRATAAAAVPAAVPEAARRTSNAVAPAPSTSAGVAPPPAANRRLPNSPQMRWSDDDAPPPYPTS